MNKHWMTSCSVWNSAENLGEKLPSRLIFKLFFWRSTLTCTFQDKRSDLKVQRGRVESGRSKCKKVYGSKWTVHFQGTLSFPLLDHWLPPPRLHVISDFPYGPYETAICLLPVRFVNRKWIFFEIYTILSLSLLSSFLMSKVSWINLRFSDFDCWLLVFEIF